MIGNSSLGEHASTLTGVSYTGHIQDPRHQKVMDHHRSTSGVTSLQSPTQPSKQVIVYFMLSVIIQSCSL